MARFIGSLFVIISIACFAECAIDSYNRCDFATGNVAGLFGIIMFIVLLYVWRGAKRVH